jgi:predicted HAD superfamily phosphohydrolase YqeG
VLVIDDRLLTGVLAGVLAGCQVRLVRDPIIQWWGNMRAELGFAALRLIERLIFKI